MLFIAILIPCQGKRIKVQNNQTVTSVGFYHAYIIHIPPHENIRQKDASIPNNYLKKKKRKRNRNWKYSNLVSLFLLFYFLFFLFLCFLFFVLDDKQQWYTELGNNNCNGRMPPMNKIFVGILLIFLIYYTIQTWYGKFFGREDQINISRKIY